MITVIGLGVETGDLTSRAIGELKRADAVLVRNSSPRSEELERLVPFETLDSIYRKSRNFDTLAKNLAEAVRRRAVGKNVCYCVDGSAEEDRAAQILIRGGAKVIGGVSKAGYAAAKAGLAGGYNAVSAYELAERRLSLPLIVYDLDDRLLAGDVKLILTEQFGDEAKALFSGSTAREISLFETDMQEEYGAFTCLAVYEIPLLEKKRFCFGDLIAILRRLRAPDGCPWDKVQTHESIRINAIEEAYELVDAIDSEDPDKICEEAGDVLMQAAFHTLIEEERGNFTVCDMLTGLCEKLITRHTHVFGTDKATGAEGALSVWDKNKMTEKHQTTFSDAVNDVPTCFPALLRAQKICKRVEKGGWTLSQEGAEAVERQLFAEIEELNEACRTGNRAEIDGELGDVLMAAASLARAVGGDAEQALLDTVKKVQRRYTEWESLVLADGKDVNALSAAERQEYYDRVKRAEHVERT